MAERDYNTTTKFKSRDKLAWWVSNLLTLAASAVLIIAVVVSLPFRRYRSRPLRITVRTLTIAGLVVIPLSIYLYYLPHQPADFGSEGRYVMINRGATVYDVAYELKKAGAIPSEMSFVVFSKFLGHSRDLKAGRYLIEPGTNMAAILRIITKGESIPFNVTIPEGSTIGQVARMISSALAFTAEDFLIACAAKQLLDSLSIPATNLEGYLFPNTYSFFVDDSPGSVARKLVYHFYENLPDSFAQKARNLGLSFHKAVAMASLIEKEARLDSERPLISAVYHSRLKTGMMLQCDPTVIYALGGLDRPLCSNDLLVDSPYNTYVYYGLPAGPICSPGRASLDAAVNPASVDYLYFVATGDGSHIFSRTNDEHVNAKNKVKTEREQNRKVENHEALR